MASDIFNVSPPAWLQALDKPLDAMMTGQVVGALAGGLINAATQNKPVGESVSDAFITLHDPMWATHKAEADLKLQLGKVALDTAKRGYEWAGEDAEVVPAWLQQDWKTRLEGPLPAVKTPQALQVVTRQRLADVRQQGTNVTMSGLTTFQKQVSEMAGMDEQAALDAIPFAQIVQQGRPPNPQELSAFYNKLSAANARQPGKTTTDVQNIKQIDEWEQQALKAEQSGNIDEAKRLRTMAEELKGKNKGFGIQIMGYDDQGRPIISMGTGMTNPTVATQSLAQQKLVRYEYATELMNNLDRVMKPGDLGVLGMGGEWLVDRSLAQLIPSLESGQRVKTRTLITSLKESLMREMADDKGRFTAADRAEIEKALPSDGVFESYARAKDALSTVRNVIGTRSRAYARSIGQQPPLFTMTPDEIVEVVKNDPKRKQEALDVLNRLYPRAQ